MAIEIKQFFPDSGEADSGQFAKSVLAEATDHALTLVSSSRLQPDVVRKWVFPIVDAYQNFECAFDDKTHPPQPWKNRLGTLNLSAPPKPWTVSDDALQHAAHAYFSGPLRSRTLERALVDALLYRAILDFLDSKAGLPAMYGRAGAYSALVLLWLLFMVMFADGWGWWSLLLSAVPALMVFTAWAFPRYGYYSRYKQMKAAYQRLAAGATSPSDVSRQLQKVGGVVPLPPQLIAVLDDVAWRGSTL